MCSTGSPCRADMLASKCVIGQDVLIDREDCCAPQLSMCNNTIMDTVSRQLVKVEASRVLGEYTHEISIDREKKFTILYGPNGVGKTKMLEIIHNISCMNTRTLKRIPFGEYL